ncbi:hypothetical protein [Pararhizobium sp. DWP3-4]|uniref:hypothetical protein n=1 Tax=Pararhizobium sp. DWP3-4 TaxID=2804565 RepID=UPI003CF315E8
MIAADIQDHVAELDRRVVKIEAHIETLIRKDWAFIAGKGSALLPGIGATIAALLIAAMPELGGINRRHTASLAGCARIPESVEN